MKPFSMMPLVMTTILCMGALMGFATVAGPLARSLGLADWHAGAVVTVSGILWMLLAPIWGRVSDKVGRKPILLIGVAGLAVAYFAIALFANIAIDDPPLILTSFAVLVAARGLVGAFYAAVPPVSVAYIADNVPPEGRASRMAQLGAASGIGMVGGPLVAGLLAGWGLAMPLYVFALLPLAALTRLWFALPNVPPVVAETRPPIRMVDPRLRLPILAAFVATLMVGTAQICVGFLMIDRLGLGLEDGARFAGFALAGVGVSMIATQMIMASIQSARPLGWIRAGASIGGIASLAIAFAPNAPTLIGAFCLSAIGMGMIFPSFQALAANAVEPNEQGSAAGTVSAMQGLGMVVGPLTASFLYGWNSAAPFLLAAALLFLLLIVASRRSAWPVWEDGGMPLSDLFGAIRSTRRQRFRVWRGRWPDAS